MHGKSVLRATKKIARVGIPSHIVPDLSQLQAGTALCTQAGFKSACIYSGTLRESLGEEDPPNTLTEDEDEGEEEADLTLGATEARLRFGQAFFVYGGGSTEKVEEMYLYVGQLEEYQLKKPLSVDSSSMHVPNPVLVGYKFKRTGTGALAWLQVRVSPPPRLLACCHHPCHGRRRNAVAIGGLSHVFGLLGDGEIVCCWHMHRGRLLAMPSPLPAFAPSHSSHPLGCRARAAPWSTTRRPSYSPPFRSTSGSTQWTARSRPSSARSCTPRSPR